ncbi:MAG: ubiquinol-cytochrome C chaperone [Rhizobiales bacterium]|nr:ubiquinol-cytochrome C chaperone [Hyphomicrobiales bacterium]NRB12813.1 ubiquinol-cytochrome C chaperone [Hyphomicrobiales bacterium]
MAKILGIYLGKERQEKKLADTLYNHTIKAARSPSLYGANGAPDTANGRFELIILHIFLLFSHLQGQDKFSQSVKQKTFDRFLEDMDMNLREIGVGPDGVPKRIQKMLENFYGRAEAYQTALESADHSQIIDSIARNLFADEKPNLAAAEILAQYMVEVVENLQQVKLDDLIHSNFSFLPK